VGELESVGQSLQPFIREISEKGPSYAPMEVDGVKIDTGSSVLNHALANYLNSAVAPSAVSGAEPSLVNRIRAQENATLATQQPAATDESYGHCVPCRLAVAPTTEAGNTGEALIDPWAGPSQTPSGGLPAFAAASDPAARNNPSGLSDLGGMNLCGNSPFESSLQLWQEEKSGQVTGGLLGLEPGLARGGKPPAANADPLSALYANAWHLGDGRLIDCYAVEPSPTAGLKTQVNYFWESPFSHVPLQKQKHLLLRITINYPFQLHQSPECDYKNPEEAMRELWSEAAVGNGETFGEKFQETKCHENVTPMLDVYGRVTTYIHKRLEREGKEVEEGKKSGIATGSLKNEECRKETNIGQQPETLHREGGAFECEITIGGEPHVEQECGASICVGKSIMEQIQEELVQLRHEVLKHVAEPNASESLNEEAPADVQQAAVRVNGARALLDDYIQLGMPNAMTEDPRLRNFVLGVGDNLADLEKAGNHLLDDSPGAPNVFSIFTREVGEIEAKGRPPILWPAAFPQEPCVEGCPTEVGLDEQANPIAEQVIEEPKRSPKRTNEHDGIVPFAFKRNVELLARRLHTDLDPPAGSSSGGAATEATAAFAEEPMVEAATTQLQLTRELLSIAPVNRKSPEVRGTPVAGETLDCSPGSWEPQPSPMFTYVWLRNGARVGAGPSYVVASGDVGQELACEVTATNRKGEAASATSAPVTVLAAAPSSAVVAPGGQIAKVLLPNPNLTIETTQKLKGSKAGFSTRELTVALARAGVAAGRHKPSRARAPRGHYKAQIIEYQITVRNTGNVPLALTNFSDPYCAHISSAGRTGEPLQPGHSTRYGCQQTVSHDGTYLNQATIEATPPVRDGFTISRVSNETVALGPNPEPTAETGRASEVTQNTGLVAGEVSPHGRKVTICEFEYWTTAGLHRARCAKSPGHGTGPVKVTARLDNLRPGTTYHYEIAAGNPTGTRRGNARQFTTLAAPEAITQTATGVG
jgi:hypothetical protein